MDREQILRRFEELLDSALSAEDPPRGVDAELLAELATGGESENDHTCDSYALWSAMTALAQEVKLQGRAFKELNETVGAQAARVGEELRAVYRERERDLERQIERRCRKQALNVLIDLHDRLGRGIESVRAGEAELAKAPQAGLLTRLFSQPEAPASRQTVAALTKGYELAIERLDQALEDFNAREIRCQGESFDPRRMNAIDREESKSVPEGTVLEVYRRGYEWNGEVFRPAQVKVACTPGAEKDHE